MTTPPNGRGGIWTRICSLRGRAPGGVHFAALFMAVPRAGGNLDPSHIWAMTDLPVRTR